MDKDFAYGIIPLMQQEDNRYTILIHLASGNHRWLPKWHPETNETSIETAMREFYEETGLSITADQVDTNQGYTEQYTCISHGKHVNKTVTYYVAQLPYTDVSQLSGYSESDGEILGKRLLSLDEAIILATHHNTKSILQQVQQSLL